MYLQGCDECNTGPQRMNGAVFPPLELVGKFNEGDVHSPGTFGNVL